MNKFAPFKDVIKEKTVNEMAKMLLKVMEPEIRAIIREELNDAQKLPGANLPGSKIK